MAKDQGVNIKAARKPATPARAKTAAKPAASAPAAVVAAAAPARKRTTIAQFAREVRVEARKISWPSWKETWITSVMVFIMVGVTSIFFSVVDLGLHFFIQQVLALAG
jgi:preprotein translocase subunit SecE